MHKILIALALTSITLPTSAYANNAKVAYVEMPRVLNEVNDGKTAKAKLKRDFEAKQKKLNAMEEQLRKKKSEFDSRAPMMKEEQRMEKASELQKEFINLQTTLERLQQELLEQEMKVTNEIAQKIRKVIAKIGDRDGYDMILDIGDTVLYYKRHKDITDDVVQAYNTQYKKK